VTRIEQLNAELCEQLKEQSEQYAHQDIRLIARAIVVALGAIADSQDDISGSEIVKDNAIVIAACGIILATRAMEIEDDYYRTSATKHTSGECASG
jgi:hypothetical protein